MTTRLPLIALAILSFNAAAFADHPIPPDSKQNWDFRGPPRTITRESFAKLFSCKTYEELRDALIKAIEDLEHEPTIRRPLYVASDCRLALIRTYYLLGEIEHADRLLEQYLSVHRDSKGQLDLSKVPLTPLQKPKANKPRHPTATSRQIELVNGVRSSAQTCGLALAIQTGHQAYIETRFQSHTVHPSNFTRIHPNRDRERIGWRGYFEFSGSAGSTRNVVEPTDFKGPARRGSPDPADGTAAPPARRGPPAWCPRQRRRWIPGWAGVPNSSIAAR